MRSIWAIMIAALLFTVVVSTTAAQPAPRPFIPPVAAPPGPTTWLFGQAYGNTVGAFLRGRDWYDAGQRLHFGVDLSMPCGTPLVAIGDGEVIFVDDLGFGSGPHNLLIRHDAQGVVSLYGHLLERPTVVVGQRVTQGQEVALSGDPDITCDSRPHLHLEIRSLNYFTTYNPLNYIEANWHALAIVGPFRYPLFQQNLDDARRWLDLYDQPDVAFGGAPLNDYRAPYPDLRAGEPPPNPLPMRDLPPPDTASAWVLRRLGFDGCCANAYWDAQDANRLYTIDGAANQRAGIFAWDVAAGAMLDLVGEAPPPHRSPDGSHIIAPAAPAPGTFTITRIADGASWTVDTRGAWPAFSTDHQRLMWQYVPEIPAPNGERLTEIWLANADGSDARAVANVPGGSAQWLDDRRLLIVRREAITTTLGVYDTRTGEAFVLGQWDWLRGLSVSPGGMRLLFYTVWGESAGLQVIETQPGALARTLPIFGGWRWRDADSIYLIPLEATSDTHTVSIIDVTTGDVITPPADERFLVANGDWSVSADGQRIAFRNALDSTTWILEPAGLSSESQP